MIDRICKCQGTVLGTQRSITGSSKQEIKHLSRETSCMGARVRVGTAMCTGPLVLTTWARPQYEAEKGGVLCALGAGGPAMHRMKQVLTWNWAPSCPVGDLLEQVLSHCSQSVPGHGGAGWLSPTLDAEPPCRRASCSESKRHRSSSLR